MWYVDTNTQIFIVTIVTIFGFFLGNAMHGVLGDEGFGSNGNMGIILAGFAGGVFAMHYLGFNLRDFRLAVSCGLIGSFTLLVSLVLMKNVMHRLGY